MASIIQAIVTSVLMGVIEKIYQWCLQKKLDSYASKIETTVAIIDSMKKAGDTEDAIRKAQAELDKLHENVNTDKVKLDYLKQFGG